MTDHVRKQVRDAVVADLEGMATFGDNVFTARVSPLTAAELPGWVVSLRDESADFDAVGIIRRTGRVVIEGAAQGGDGLEDKLDAMAAAAEAALMDAGGALRGLVQVIGPPTTQIDIGDSDAGNGRRTGRIGIAFQVGYRTAEGDPTVVV